MKSIFLGAAILAFSVGRAQADTMTASLYTPLAPTGGETTIVTLSGISTPSQDSILGTDYLISFSSVGANEGVLQGPSSGAGAVPVAGVTAGEPEYLTDGFGSGITTNMAASGNYLSTGTGTVTITFSTPETSLALLWGSIDTGNLLTFNDAANFAVSGSDVQLAASGFVGNGFQGPGGSAYVVVDTSSPFTTVNLSSSVISFESAALAASNAPFVNTPTPEPSTFALLGTGLLGVAGVIRKRLV